MALGLGIGVPIWVDLSEIPTYMDLRVGSVTERKMERGLPQPEVRWMAFSIWYSRNHVLWLPNPMHYEGRC